MIEEGHRTISEMPHWDFQESPFPDISGVVDFQIEKYPISQEEKKALHKAFHTTGFVGHSARHGWIYFSSGGGGNEEVRKAHPTELNKLPNLPMGWEHFIRRA